MVHPKEEGEVSEILEKSLCTLIGLLSSAPAFFLVLLIPFLHLSFSLSPVSTLIPPIAALSGTGEHYHSTECARCESCSCQAESLSGMSSVTDVSYEIMHECDITFPSMFHMHSTGLDNELLNEYVSKNCIMQCICIVFW